MQCLTVDLRKWLFSSLIVRSNWSRRWETIGIGARIYFCHHPNHWICTKKKPFSATSMKRRNNIDAFLMLKSSGLRNPSSAIIEVVLIFSCSIKILLCANTKSIIGKGDFLVSVAPETVMELIAWRSTYGRQSPSFITSNALTICFPRNAYF